MLFRINRPHLPLAVAGCLLWGCQSPDFSTKADDSRLELAVSAIVGVPTALPGRVQAEDYVGTIGSGYRDLTAGNEGRVYRGDDVDIGTVTTGGYAIGWTQATEWVTYDLTVSAATTFNLVASMASGVSGTKTIAVAIDGANKGSFSFTDASGWNTYKNATLNGIAIGAGSHKLRLTFTTGGVNLNYVDFLPAGQVFTSVMTTTSHTFFLKNSALWGVGWQERGTLGDGATQGSIATPKAIPFSSPVRMVAGDYGFTHVLNQSSVLYAVGDNEWGQLGDGTNVPKTTLKEVYQNVREVAAGTYHTLIVKNDNTAWGTGMNTDGRLGNGNRNNQKSFQFIRNNVAWVSGSNLNSYFVGTDGVLWASGANDRGQVGIAPNSTFYSTPVRVTDRVKKAFGTYGGIVILRTDGTVWSVGTSPHGELGLNENSAFRSLTQVISNVKDIGAGVSHSVFLLNSGVVMASGWGYYLGQPGATFPFPTTIWTDIASISVGSQNTFVRDLSGNVWGTGVNISGELGYGGYDPGETPWHTNWERVKY